MYIFSVCMAKPYKLAKKICLVVILVTLTSLLSRFLSPKQVFSQKLSRLTPWQEKHVHRQVPLSVSDNITELKPMYPIHSLGLYFYGGFLDDREDPDVLRIFGIRRNDTILDDFHCEWKLSDGEATITFQVKVKWSDIDSRWPKFNKFFAFMLTCAVSGQKVSIAELRSSLKVVSTDRKYSVDIALRNFPSLFPKQKLLTVCVKPMTGQFSVEKLIEWIEIQRAAGIDHFILYNTDVYGASRFVIEYYKNLGILIEISFPYLTTVLEVAEKTTTMESSLRYALYQQIYLIALHDCLYRFRKSFRYIMYIDIDEVILPINDETMSAMIHRSEVHAPGSASFVFYTCWHYKEFTKSLPKDINHLYMQTYAWAPRPQMDQPKSIVNSDKTLTVNWHGLLDATPNSNFSRYLLSWWEYGYVHHYREGQCKELFKDECQKMAETLRHDQVIARYRNITDCNVLKVLSHLEL